MKNPILVPEFREYLSHNNIEALREIYAAERPAAVAVARFFAPTDSAIPIYPPIPDESPFQALMGGLCHD